MLTRFLLIVATGLAATLSVTLASAGDAYELNCTLDRYSPGSSYSEETLKSWIPDSLEISVYGEREILLMPPNPKFRFRGERTRENDKKFSARIGVREKDENGLDQSFTYEIEYFKESGKIYITGAFPVTYAPLGNAAGTCQRLPETQSATSSGPPAPADRAGWEERALALKWDGVSDLLAGKIYFKRGESAGQLSVDLPGGEEKCAGSYSLGSEQGTWAVACPDGVTASGTYKGFGSGKGSAGEGTDSKGRNIRFTVSSR